MGGSARSGGFAEGGALFSDAVSFQSTADSFLANRVNGGAGGSAGRSGDGGNGTFGGVSGAGVNASNNGGSGGDGTSSGDAGAAGDGGDASGGGWFLAAGATHSSGDSFRTDSATGVSWVAPAAAAAPAAPGGDGGSARAPGNAARCWRERWIARQRCDRGYGHCRRRRR